MGPSRFGSTCSRYAVRETEEDETVDKLRSSPQALNGAGFARQHVFAWTVVLGILAFYGAAATWSPVVYIWSTYEDLFGEWIQFWSLFVAWAVMVRLAMIHRSARWFFAILAAACFYVSMEEISWGQRLLGFSSPEFFRANNLQGETNLHNFLTGPYSTRLKAHITSALAACLATYGLLYPLALSLRSSMAVWINTRGLAAPPLYLSPFFVAAAVLELSPFGFNEAEVAELLVGLGMALMAVHHLVSERYPSRNDWDENKLRPDRRSRRLTFRLCGATALTLLLAIGTTGAVYASPSGKSRINKRLENGIKKFAGRYARRGHWAIAADLYLRLRSEAPHSTYLLRKLAECHGEMGDYARRDAYLDEALALDLKRYRKEPTLASVNRSLVRTYRLAGDESGADKHLGEALSASLRSVGKDSTSASAAYSLGKTYTLMERHGDALENLARAYKLGPTSKKYRKAYYAARNRVH